MSIFEDVHSMYYRFGFPIAKIPTLLEPELMQGRLEFLLEELNETSDAYDEDDLPEVIDGLIDLIVVAAGTLALMGVDSQAHWDEVRRANNDKLPGKKKGRNMQFDLYKPEGWKPPNHERLL
jgi:predicted HAD superfamily Cof-like phosphohydrolase